jgi:hypothetical protein
MDDSKWLSREQMRAFLCGAEPVEFAAQGRAELDLLAEAALAMQRAKRELFRRIGRTMA